MGLKIENVSKKYSDTIALDGVSMEFGKGVYGLLGANGAGKSTLLKIITGLLAADGGRVSYNGKDISSLGEDYRSVIGYMPQQQALYPEFRVYEYLNYIALIKGLKKTEIRDETSRVLEAVNLSGESRKKIKSLSGGMKQRVMLAQAMTGSPEILILDEPSAGLDPKERVRMRNLIAEMSLNRTVILATHIVSDIEMLADRVIILKKGRTVACGNMLDIRKSLQGKVFRMVCEESRYHQEASGRLVSGIGKTKDGKVWLRFISDRPETGCEECFPELEDIYLYNFRDEE